MKLIARLLTPEIIEAALRQPDVSVTLGDVQCLRLKPACSMAAMAEKMAGALANQPVEIRAAGRVELQVFLRNFVKRDIADYVLRRIINMLNLPDDPVQYVKEHEEAARRVMHEALAGCVVCIITPTEFVEKFVKEVYAARDRRGRAVFKIVIKTGGGDDDERTITIPHSAFRRKKKIVVPPELNDALRMELGVEILPQMGVDLRSFLENIAKNDYVEQQVMLVTALGRTVAQLPLLGQYTDRGRWCVGGKMYVPLKLINDIVGAFAIKFGNKHAFVKIARQFGVLDADHLIRYTPEGSRCNKCMSAYVFNVEKVAELLNTTVEEICGEEI